MNEMFAKSLYDLIVRENLEDYKNLYKTAVVDAKTDPYYKDALNLYNSLPEDKRKILLKIIEQTMVDTISSILGIIDGSIPVNEKDSVEPKLFLNSMDTEGELQDLFLEHVEELENNK
ncbi:transposase [Planococcus halotolerans]|uniref:Transposase n=1 Tax=Planococcus halotolerans TaxID=2233542 RepID=A0A365KK93_9BACL|nr:transposase [Planococcus halotolerans]RAZ73476.1 transposase [Planococcus halotolerans]